MANEIARLFAQLGFRVDYSGLRTYEQKLKSVQKQINSTSGVSGDYKKAGAAQSNFYKELTRGYAKVKPTLQDHKNNLKRIDEAVKKNIITTEQWNDARMRTLHAISQTEKRMHRERMARIRREQAAQGPFAGGQDPRQRGTHNLISALHSDVGLGTMIGGFAAIQSARSYQDFVGMRQGISAAVGSPEEGAKEIQFLTEMSNKLGISLREAADGYKNFVASTQGTELAGKETRKMFEAVSSYSRVLNLTADDQKGVFRALTQMVSKGRVQAEEINESSLAA